MTMDDRYSMPDRRNSEQYDDPTAYAAMKNIIIAEREVKKKSDNLIGTIKLLADLAGFEIVGRIHLRHKKSGAEFR